MDAQSSSTLATLSSITGMLSIICWFIVFTPQIWINYKRQSGESLSLPFLYIWLLGDLFNVAGVTLDNLLLTMIVLIMQVYYYRRKARLASSSTNRRCTGDDNQDSDSSSDESSDSESHVPDEESALLGKQIASPINHHNNNNNNNNNSNNNNSSNNYSSIPANSSTHHSMDHRHRHHHHQQSLCGRVRMFFRRRRVRQCLVVLLPTMATAFFVWAFFEYRRCVLQGEIGHGYQILQEDGSVDEWWSWVKCSGGHKMPPAPEHGATEFQILGHHDSDSNGNDGNSDHDKSWLPIFLGWSCAILYWGSRIPQLYKNWVLQSCEGLSIMMFTFTVLGNVLFVASILLNSLDPDYLYRNMPWWLGSCGTLIFDIMIFCQFYLYKDNSPSTTSHKDMENEEIQA
ncbi:hypothetical protein BX616_001113 [Lobosporangium transversale]|nr:hypothetical protein BX616_001113 [Lobosporangium transversale]